MNRVEYIKAINEELDKMRSDKEAVHRLSLTMESVAIQLGWLVQREEKPIDVLPTKS